MIDIVVVAQSILQMDIIVNGRNNVLFRNMLWNQVMNIPPNDILKFIDVTAGLIKNSLKNRIIHLLRNPYLFRVNLHDCIKIHHHIGNHLDASFLLRSVNPHKRNCRILNLLCHLASHLRSRLGNNLSRNRACNILCKHLSGDTVFQSQLLIKLISSYLSQIIASGVKEHTRNQALCAVYSKRLAWTNLLI